MNLTELERRELLEAWPWPQEAATTRDGFADVVSAVERILDGRLVGRHAPGPDEFYMPELVYPDPEPGSPADLSVPSFRRVTDFDFEEMPPRKCWYLGGPTPPLRPAPMPNPVVKPLAHTRLLLLAIAIAMTGVCVALGMWAAALDGAAR